MFFCTTIQKLSSVVDSSDQNEKVIAVKQTHKIEAHLTNMNPLNIFLSLQTDCPNLQWDTHEKTTLKICSQIALNLYLAYATTAVQTHEKLPPLGGMYSKFE